MAYRNGVYAAFDGQGTTNPTKSDIRYFRLLKIWAEAKKESLNYIDSHEKTRAVRDWSHEETLKAVLRQRLSHSKVMFLILSHQTSYNRGFLNYEIEKALDTYKIPLVIAYPDLDDFPIKSQWKLLQQRWPKALEIRLNDRTRKDLSCLHIHFKREFIERALKDMTVHNKIYLDSLLVYNN